MDEYADFIASLAQSAEIEKQILDGTFAPMVTVLLPVPMELREIINIIGNIKASNFVEFGLRFFLPILDTKPLKQNRVANPTSLIKEYIEMYLDYNKLVELQTYIKILTNVIESLSIRLSKELVKYDLKNTMVTLAVNKNNVMFKYIEVMIFGNYTDPETGEWIYYV